MSTKKPPAIDLQDNDFNSILVCAIRYCLGRRTYMPGVVTGYIWQLLPYLPQMTLTVMQRDIRQAGSYGDECIDKPVWSWFLDEIEQELRHRSK